MLAVYISKKLTISIRNKHIGYNEEVYNGHCDGYDIFVIVMDLSQ